MRVIKQMLVVVAAGAVAMGCGSDDNECGDAGCPDGSAYLDGGSTGDGPMLWGLTRGTNDYTVTKAMASGSDGCMLAAGLASLVGMKRPVTYDQSTQMIGVGDLKGTPPTPSFGTGKVSNNMATLMRDNQAGPSATCYWHQVNTGTLTLFNHDKFTVDTTETQNMFAAGCTGADAPPAGGTCTSTYSVTFELTPSGS
jgi:hypothetical protein